MGKKKVAEVAPNYVATSLQLTRENLEDALVGWALTREGLIAKEYILLLLMNGGVIEALDLVAKSMQHKKEQFKENDSCIVWTAWMNYQAFGTPGFPLTQSTPV